MARSKKFAVPLLLFLAGLAAPQLITNFEYQGLLVLTMIYAIMALSLAVIMGQAGQWSFGHQAFLGFGAYGAVLLARDLGLPVLLALVLGALIAAAIGAALALVALRRTRGMHLAVITLAFGVIVYLIALQWHGLTGGRVGIFLPDSPKIGPGDGWIRFDTDVSYYYLAFAALCLTILGLIVLSRHKPGRALRAISGNEMLARAAGIGPLGYLVFAFGLGAGLVGLSGGLLSYYLGVVNPGLMSIDYLFAMLIMVILGGSGTIAGPVIGAFIYVWLPELLGVGDDLKLFVFAIILAVVVALYPNGLYPQARQVISRLRSRRRDAGVSGDSVRVGEGAR